MAYDSKQTREKILRAAERLFADSGYDGVSVRQIAAAAGVQLALISYHFRSKEGLYRAVFARRMEPISTDRLARLGKLHAAAGPASVEEIITALIQPWFELRKRRGGLAYSRLVERELGDPEEARRGIVKEIFDPIASEFLVALERALPGHGRAEIHWAYHALIGALLMILVNTGRIKRLSGSLCDVANPEATLAALVTFFANGLRVREDGSRRSSRSPIAKRRKQP